VEGACGGRGGIGGAGGLGIGADAVGTIWLTLRAPISKPIRRTELDAGVGGFGTDVLADVALPNSNTAARAGACGTPPRFKFISSALPGLESVKLAFFSAGLNVVSSWSIIGAGSAVGFGAGVGTGTDIVVGIGTPALTLIFACGAGCFDQPMSERVAGFGVDGIILLGAISFFEEASMSWRIFGADPIEKPPNLLIGE
jgi:hypothetical protein